jgi:Domain of unknown function (DUF4382)
MVSSAKAHLRPPLAAAALALAAMAGCSDSQGPGGTTALSIRLKDAPGDVQAAVVTVSEVDLVGSGGVLVLTETPTTVDLLTLAASTATLVQDAEVPSGTYGQLRFKITGACLRVDDGGGASSIHATAGYDATPCGGTATGTLQAPSYAQSGLKVTMDDGALTITGTQKILLVDFDVRQSFGHEAGGSGKWVMHPVVTGGDITATGSVHATAQLGAGVTLPALGGTETTLADCSAVLVAGASDTVAVIPLSDADGDGVYAADFDYLAPASYALSLKLSDGAAALTTTPATPAPVTVTSGHETAAALTVTGAS